MLMSQQQEGDLKVGFEWRLMVRDADREGLVGQFNFYELCG